MQLEKVNFVHPSFENDDGYSMTMVGYTDGSTWNGWANIYVTVEVHNNIVAHILNKQGKTMSQARAEADSQDWAEEFDEFHNIEPFMYNNVNSSIDKTMLVSYANCWCCWIPDVIEARDNPAAESKSDPAVVKHCSCEYWVDEHDGDGKCDMPMAVIDDEGKLYCVECRGALTVCADFELDKVIYNNLPNPSDVQEMISELRSHDHQDISNEYLEECACVLDKHLVMFFNIMSATNKLNSNS